MKGYITSTIKNEGGGIDEDTGHPIPPSTEETDLIECRYLPNNRSTVGAPDEGTFKIASYEITVDMLDWNIDDISLLNLYNKNKTKITSAPVLTLDELDDIQRIKITI